MPTTDCGMLFKLITDTIEKEGNNHLRAHNMTLSQLRYISYIYEAPQDRIPLKQLEAFFGVSQPTVAGVVSRMVKKGFLLLEQSQEDPRAKTVCLTPMGQSFAQEAETTKAATENALLAPLSPEERILFWDMLKRVNHGLNGT